MTNNKTFDFKENNFSTILKYSIVGIILSLLLGVIFYFIFSYTYEESMKYASYLFLGLQPYSFYLGSIIALLILTPHIRNLLDSVIVGIIVGLFTGLLQQTAVLMVFGGQELMFFIEFIGNQTVELIVFGIIAAYIGNTILKDKNHFSTIKKYLGE